MPVHPKAIIGVLLDIDDTLVDTRGAFKHALATVAAQYLPAGWDADVLVTFWREDQHGWYRAYTRGEMDHREQRKRRANDLHAAFGGPQLDDAAYDAWDEGFEQAFKQGWKAHADAVALLDALDAAGIAYGAVSNADSRYQAGKLKAVGLDRVPMLVGTDRFGVGKPDGRVFREGARLLGLDSRLTAYVGDEKDIDAAAALEAGLGLGVWLDRPDGHPQPGELAPGVVRVESLIDVLGVLKVS